MSSTREGNKNQSESNNKNIAEIINSGNSTNHINVCSNAKSNVASSVKAEAEQEQEQEQEIDF